MPANFPPLMNQGPTDAQMALKTALAREVALQSYLEKQRLDMVNESSEAQDTATSLTTCLTASKRVHQALDNLRTAVADVKSSVSDAISRHDSVADTTNKLSTTANAKDAWRDLVQLLEALTPQINSTTISTESHILSTTDEISTYSFFAECAEHSVTSPV